MNRRSFGAMLLKGIAALGVGSVVSVTTACPAWLVSIYTDILKYVPTGLSAFSVILSILSGAGLLPPGADAAINVIINLVKAGFADLQTAITQYQNAPAAQKAGLLGAISTALAIVESDVQMFWSNLNIPDGNLASLIQGLLGVIISTLAAFASAIPAPPPSDALAAAHQRRASLAKIITVPPQRRTVKQFKKAFNADLAASGYNQYCIW